MNGFKNRADAGKRLAKAIEVYSQQPDVLLLALPRGGVPVAYEVATALHIPMDVLVVRKLGMPGQEEYAMGAIASGGVRVLNESPWVSNSTIERVTEREMVELRRREIAYRGDRPFPSLSGRTVILVDDGLATGSTMRAAVQAVRQQGPDRIVVAIPVAPRETVEDLRKEVDEVVCLMTPSQFYGVGQFYQDFSQTTDDQVRNDLERAWKSTSVIEANEQGNI